MSLFCDVALPVPLERSFTYALGGLQAEAGVRVLVPFAGQRLLGVVLRVHDEAPPAGVEIKPVQRVLDDEALLSSELLELGRWIATYYCAPLGEVLRGMMPLSAEVRRQWSYRIADAGRRVLYDGAAKGSSRRSRLSVEDQNREYAVLNYLESGEGARPPGIRAATGANKALLDGMVRKKWLAREPLAEVRDARRLLKVAVLVGELGGEAAGEPGRETNAGGVGAATRAVALGEAAEVGGGCVAGGEAAAAGDGAAAAGSRAEAAPVDEADAAAGSDIPMPESGARASTESGTPAEGRSRRLPKLNDNQLTAMAELAGAGGRLALRELRERLGRRGVPESTLPSLVRRGLVALEDVPEDFAISSLAVEGKRFAHEHTLNEAQTEALGTMAAAMAKGGFRPHLLYGVTGSGKTAVYVAAMQRALAAGGSALLLVPEIGLTPATAATMVAAFGKEVALLHSQLTPEERAEQWHRIRRGEARVVVGTRSAVFAPMAHLRLILVDEEHDGSYKQEETPRYHARDAAVMRAKLLGCTVVLGSATPSLESWHNAERGRYALVQMTARVGNRPLPTVELVDMREEFRATGQEAMFSRQLLAETQAALDRGEQAIILINRRGYSFVVMCRSCGEKLECENCAISLTFHKAGDEDELGGRARVGTRLECHYCGYRRAVPQQCPKCASEHLFFLGAGSQQGEEKLAELFPQARLGRMDRDTVRTRGDMERLLNQLHSGEINLLVGTQMIAKGHDVHGVTLVGVVGADFALGLPDFRSAERVFQLITQVSGRAGRGDLPGRVLVQSYTPEHYVHSFARHHDFPGFAAREMYFRRGMRYPPVAVLTNVLLQGERLEDVLEWATKLGRWLAAQRPEGVRILGPAPAPLARLKRIYRYHLLLKADRRDRLAPLLRAMLGELEALGVPRRAVVVDVDAVHLM